MTSVGEIRSHNLPITNDPILSSKPPPRRKTKVDRRDRANKKLIDVVLDTLDYFCQKTIVTCKSTLVAQIKFFYKLTFSVELLSIFNTIFSPMCCEKGQTCSSKVEKMTSVIIDLVTKNPPKLLNTKSMKV